MGWKRINGRMYYYQSVREGRRVRSRYLGTAESAAAFAEIDALDRREREAEREEERAAERAERERADAEDRAVAEWFDQVEAIARAVLIAAGYHQHKRGEWRKRRGHASDPGPAEGPRAEAEKKALLKRAAKGDTSCLPEVRAWLDAAPGLVAANGSPFGTLIDELVAGCSTNLVMQEAARRKLAELRTQLEGPNPTQIERLLAGRAAVCWFLVNRYETAYERSSDISIRQADYQQRLIDAAHRRFLSSVKTLATVRKLALPALQVNIGANQVNVAGTTSPAIVPPTARG